VERRRSLTGQTLEEEAAMRVRQIWSPGWLKCQADMEKDILLGKKETVLDVLTDEAIHCKVEALLSRQQMEGAEKVSVVSGMGIPVDEVYIKVLRVLEE
jgi:hypothetical protein